MTLGDATATGGTTGTPVVFIRTAAVIAFRVVLAALVIVYEL